MLIKTRLLDISNFYKNILLLIFISGVGIYLGKFIVEYKLNALFISVIPCILILFLLYPILSYYTVVFLMPFNALPKLYATPYLSPIKLVGLIALLVFILQKLINRDLRLIDRSKESKLVFIFMGFVLFSSLIIAKDKIAALADLQRYSLFLILYILTVFYLKTEARFVTVLCVCVFSSLLMIVLGLLYFYGISDVALYLVAEPQLEGYQRFTGIMTNPNLVGIQVAGLLPFAVYLSIITRKRFLRFLFQCIAAIMALVVILSGSRGGLLGLAIALLLSILIFKGKMNKMFLLGSVVIVIVAIFTPYLSSTLQVPQRIQFQEAVHSRSFQYRSIVYRTGLNMFLHNSLFGVGVGNFPTSYNKYRFAGDYLDSREAHSAYISILGEYGLIGFTIFFLLIVSILKKHLINIRNLPHKSKQYYLTFAYIATVLTFLTLAFTSEIHHCKLFWLIFGLSASISNIYRRNQRITSTLRMMEH